MHDDDALGISPRQGEVVGDEQHAIRAPKRGRA
jgi:hypothetical protein